MATPRRARGPSVALALAFVCALAIGLAAALLAGPTVPFVPPTPAGSGDQSGLLEAIGYGGLLAIVGYAAFHLFQSFRAGRMPVPGRAIVTFGIAFLVAVAFLIGARFVANDLAPATHSTGANNSTTPPPPPNGGGSATTNATPTIAPATWGYGLVAGVAVALAVVFVLQLLWVRRSDRASAAVPVPVSESRRRLLAAIAALDADAAADPRAAIIAAYGRLIGRLEPALGDLSARTAREVRAASVDELGIRPSTFQELTSLFEEARYSPHPVGAAEAERARGALREALAEIDRVRPVAWAGSA